jgi:hypothetical protein
MTRVRFIKGWQGYSKGNEITPPATLREWLLRGNFVEICEEKPKAKRRGRPRKSNTTQPAKPKRS